MAETKSKKGLGRGLNNFFGDVNAGEEQVTSLPIQKVEPNPTQPRKVFDPEELELLAESIRQHGIIQPLTVRKEESGYYQIIAGERRWRAARLAGLRTVPVVVLEVDDREAMELALIENLQRQDLNPMEEAAGFRQLMDQYGMTQEQVAERVGKSRPAVANSLRLLALPEAIAAMVTEGSLSAGHARALMVLDSARQQEKAAQKILALRLSVRQAEELCKSMAKQEKAPKPKEKSGEVQVDYVAECEKSLSKHLSRGVRIVPGKRKGRLELEYYGEEDLQRLYEALQNMKL